MVQFTGVRIHKNSHGSCSLKKSLDQEFFQHPVIVVLYTGVASFLSKSEDIDLSLPPKST